MDELTEQILPDAVPAEDSAADAAFPVAEPAGPPVGFTAPAANTEPTAPISERRAHENIFWIERSLIESNPYQPRREFDQAALEDLARSLKAHGMLQPIIVSRIEVQTPRGLEVRYQLIAGERRWRAAAIAGMDQVPVIIKKEPTDRMKLELAVIENLQREDLNPLERARAFRQLMDEFHLVQREVAERIGKSREMIANTIRLLSLRPDLQDALLRGDITEGHARAILMAGQDDELQHKIFHEIVANKLTVRAAEDFARRTLGRQARTRRRQGSPGDAETLDWESRLQEIFGTKVHVQKIGERGKIVIEFYSDEELRSIIDKVLQEKDIEHSLPAGNLSDLPLPDLPTQPEGEV